MTVEADLERARVANLPGGDVAEWKGKTRAALDRAATEANLRAMADAELTELRKTTDKQRRRIELLETAIRIQPDPAFSKGEVDRAKAEADRARKDMQTAQKARDNARAREQEAHTMATIIKTRADERAAAAEERARAAEARIRPAEEKAERALSEGFKQGVAKMRDAFIQAVIAEKRGIPAGYVRAMNEDERSVEEKVFDKAMDLVGQIVDKLDDTPPFGADK